MIDYLKKKIKKIPGSINCYEKLLWKRHLMSDLINTIFRSKITFKTPFGFELSARNFVAHRAMAAWQFELEENNILKKMLLDSDVFIDIGANIGLYTCLAQSLGKHTVSFEPQPINLEFLFTNLTNNGWHHAEIFPIGLSDTRGMATLYGASGPSASLIGGWAEYSKKYRQTIALNTLDSVIGGRFQGDKLLIKIDVEGAEYNVLRGAMETLRKRTPRPQWFVEICLGEFHPGRMNAHYADIFNMFWDAGYTAYSVGKEEREVERSDIGAWINCRKTPDGNFNYFFVAKPG